MTGEPAAVAMGRIFRERWGEPAEVFQFDASQVRPGRTAQFERLQILYWPPDAASDLARFATVGMSSRMMLGAMHRAELCYRKLGDVPPAEMPAFVRFLANLAVHPFVHQTSFDWGHSVKLEAAPPGFPGCRAVLFHSALPGDESDTLPTGEGPVRLLNVIPLTAEEIAIQSTHGTPALVSHFDRGRVDVFRPRREKGERGA